MSSGAGQSSGPFANMWGIAMRLDHATWPEVETYLADNRGIILPTGSIEQHGPMGLIGTDAFCADLIAERAADLAEAMMAPVIAYAPAPFNTGFPGTISISAELYQALATEILQGLAEQGFQRIYVLNAHGANLAPLKQAAETLPSEAVRIRSWWDFAPVNDVRSRSFGDWEGMHATPSEISITQAKVRLVTSLDAKDPPVKLDAAFIAAHAGDRHGPPDEHRAMFPDGRVGSHSTLADPKIGEVLVETAAQAVATDFQFFAHDLQDGPKD